MREEWKIYRRELLKSTKSVFLALGVSLAFFVAALPELKPGEHLRSFLISLTHGLFIFTWIWLFYAVVHAVITHTKVKTGRQMLIPWPMHGTLGFAGMGIGLVTAKAFLAYVLDRPFNLSSIWESLVIGAFIALMFQFYYAYKHSAAENAELRASRMAAELHVLKNQMQPHFLFNSLNSLAELIESNKNHASTMTQKLADLYREILENSKFQVVPVSSEISIIRKYLELEKLRFGERLSYSVVEPENQEHIYIPSLILQTLVENAVKHAISKSVSGGDIQVKVHKNGNGYKAEISNSGSTLETKGNGGTGIANTKSRLDLLYGDRHQFDLKIQDNIARVSFWFSGEKIGN